MPAERISTVGGTFPIKTWAQVIEESKARLQFFQEKLEYQVDVSTFVSRVQKFLVGVVTDEEAGEVSERCCHGNWRGVSYGWRVASCYEQDQRTADIGFLQR